MSRRLVLTAALAMLATAACTMPVLPPDPPPTPPPPAASGERVVFGASISWQTNGYSDDAGIRWELHPGKGLEDIRSQIDAKLATTPTTVWLADISTNSAGTWDHRDGWTGDDEWYWWTTLMNTQQNTCVVMVLPHLTPAAEAQNPGVLAHVEAARAWLGRAQAETPWLDVVLADWRLWAGPHIGLDGIHVVAGPEAAGAWLGMLAEAEGRCDR